MPVLCGHFFKSKMWPLCRTVMIGRVFGCGLCRLGSDTFIYDQMISSSQGKKKIPAVFLSALFSLLDLLARSLRDNVLGAVGGSQTCICALTWALEVMLVPLTFFILHFPSLYQIHFCICCNFPPLPPCQANNASTYGVVRV